MVERRIEAARLLFPQLLARRGAVRAKVRERVDNARIEEIALEQYRSAIVERLVAAIEPDEDEGEAPILPRIDRQRPVDSTAGVQFRTARQTMGHGEESHLARGAGQQLGELGRGEDGDEPARAGVRQEWPPGLRNLL